MDPMNCSLPTEVPDVSFEAFTAMFQVEVFNLKMNAIWTFEKLVSYHKTTRRHEQKPRLEAEITY
jgi:hypothetical protein